MKFKSHSFKLSSSFFIQSLMLLLVLGCANLDCANLDCANRDCVEASSMYHRKAKSLEHFAARAVMQSGTSSSELRDRFGPIITEKAVRMVEDDYESKRAQLAARRSRRYSREEFARDLLLSPEYLNINRTMSRWDIKKHLGRCARTSLSCCSNETDAKFALACVCTAMCCCTFLACQVIETNQDVVNRGMNLACCDASMCYPGCEDMSFPPKNGIEFTGTSRMLSLEYEEVVKFIIPWVKRACSFFTCISWCSLCCDNLFIPLLPGPQYANRRRRLPIDQ